MIKLVIENRQVRFEVHAEAARRAGLGLGPRLLELGRVVKGHGNSVMKRQLDPERFRVGEGRKVRLRDRPTRVAPFYKAKPEYESWLAQHIEQLSELQSLLFAHNRYALLLIFQAMDAAGKDSAIKHVMSGVNPQGCQVFSFKHTSTCTSRKKNSASACSSGSRNRTRTGS